MQAQIFEGQDKGSVIGELQFSRGLPTHLLADEMPGNAIDYLLERDPWIELHDSCQSAIGRQHAEKDNQATNG